MALVTLCVFITATACGGPTETYKACYEYLQSEGGTTKLENLNDPHFGSLDIEFTNGDRCMTAEFSWADTIARSITYTFYENDNQHVDIEYSTTRIGSTSSSLQITVITLEGTCANLTDMSTYTTLAVAYATSGQNAIALEETDPIYIQTNNEIKNYIPRSVTWISAAIQVLLDDDSLSVQDLYDPAEK